MDDVVDWLNKNSGAVQAIATVVLVLVTAFYVILTWSISKKAGKQAEASMKMAQEMERAREASLRPVLLIEPEESEGRGTIRKAVAAERGDFDESIPCDLCNVGPGPALNVRLNVKGLDSDFERELIHLAGDGRPRREYLRLEVDPDLSKGQEETRIIRVEYEDVYGNRFSSLLTVRLDPQHRRPLYQLLLLEHGRAGAQTHHHVGQQHESAPQSSPEKRQ